MWGWGEAEEVFENQEEWGDDLRGSATDRPLAYQDEGEKRKTAKINPPINKPGSVYYTSFTNPLTESVCLPEPVYQS